MAVTAFPMGRCHPGIGNRCEHLFGSAIFTSDGRGNCPDRQTEKAGRELTGCEVGDLYRPAKAAPMHDPSRCFAAAIDEGHRNFDPTAQAYLIQKTEGANR
jgi:hypothetical protein